jgi:hypothetical protein
MTLITYYIRTRVLYQIPLSTTNAADCGLLTIHEPNAPFRVTIHQIRMMCDTDILQLFCVDTRVVQVKRGLLILQASIGILALQY